MTPVRKRFRSRDQNPSAPYPAEPINGSNGAATMPPPPSEQALPEEDLLVEGIFEPPRSFAVAAIMRHKGSVVFVSLLLALLGLVYGLVRQPTYEASATLQVGQVNPNSPGFFSYVQSSSSLATAFSRAIYAAPVLGAVERKLGIPAEQAAPKLASEPIALSPAFRVIAEGDSKEEAMSLANAAANGVIAYEGKTNSVDPQAANLLREYQAATKDLRQAGERVADRQAGDSEEELLTAEAQRSAAKVRQKAIANAYIAAVGSAAPRVGLVSLLAGATTAKSDSHSKAQLFAFLGLLAGIVLGCAIAILVERRRLNRRLTDLPGGGPAPAPS